MGRRLIELNTREGFKVYVPEGTPPEVARTLVEEARAAGELGPNAVLEAASPEPDVYYGEGGQPFDEPGPGRTPATMGGGGVQGPGGLEITMRPEPMQGALARATPPRYSEPPGGGAPVGEFVGQEAAPKLTGDAYNSALITSGMNGVMGEFGDEFLGATAATFDMANQALGGEVAQPKASWPTRYQMFRDRARSLDKAILEEDPAAGYGVRIGGALATGAGALPGLARGAISRAAPQMAERLAAAKSSQTLPGLADRAVEAATQGAIAGAVTGFGAGEGAEGDESVLGGLENRAKSALFGTVVGGGLGAATPPVLAVGSQLARGARSLLPTGLAGAERRAAEIVAQDVGNTIPPPQKLPLGSSQPSPAAVMGGAAGGKIKDLAIADVSDQARRTLGHVARGKGLGAEKATEFMRRRQHGTADIPGERGGGQWVEVKRHIKEVISGRDLPALLKKLGAGMSAQAKQLYGKAFAHPPIDTLEARELASLPDVQKGLREGLRIAKNLGELPSGVKLPKDGDLILPVNVWHTAKMGLDDMIGAAHRAGNKNLARSLIHLKERVLDMLNDATGGDLAKGVAGDYTIARTAYAGAAAMRTAADLGTEFMDAAVSGGDIAESLAKMSDLEKQFYRAGAADAMIRKVESLPTGADSARKFFNTPQIKNKLAALTENEADYADLIRRMKLESAKFKTADELEGSQTALRSQVGQAVEEAIDDGVDPVSLVSGQGGARWLMTWLQTNVGTRPTSFRVKEHLAQMLSTTDPVEQQRVAKLMSDAAERILARRRMQSRARGGALMATAGSSQAAIRQPEPRKVNPAKQGFRYSDPEKGGDGYWWRPAPNGTWEEGPFESWRER